MFLAWIHIRIRIEKKGWIRIRKKNNVDPQKKPMKKSNPHFKFHLELWCPARPASLSTSVGMCTVFLIPEKANTILKHLI